MEAALLLVMVSILVVFGLMGLGATFFLIAVGSAEVMRAKKPRIQIPPAVSKDEHVRSGQLVDTFLRQLSQQYETRVAQALSATPERRSSDDEEEK